MVQRSLGLTTHLVWWHPPWTASCRYLEEKKSHGHHLRVIWRPN